MLKSFFLSPEWRLWSWGGLVLLFSLIGLEVQVLVWLNGWYRETWDFLQNPHPLIKEAVSNPDVDWNQSLAELDDEATKEAGEATTLSELGEKQLDKFWGLLLEFCWVVFPYIFVRVFTNFFARHYAFRWRQAITFAYLPLWSNLNSRPGERSLDIEGASQRLQQDPERFSRLLERLGLDFFRSALTLIAFIPILLMVSAEISDNLDKAFGLDLDNPPFALPFLTWTATTTGSLMWVALALAVGGTGLSYFIGIKLPGLEYNNQKMEARFRKQLVYSEDDKQYADIPTLTELFTGLRFNYFRLFLHYSYFGLWATMFTQFIIIADLVLIGTGVVLGAITLGFLNQISHAFSKVADGLAYFVDNWTTVTELLSVIKRLREFERNIGYSGPPLEADELPVQKVR